MAAIVTCVACQRGDEATVDLQRGWPLEELCEARGPLHGHWAYWHATVLVCDDTPMVASPQSNERSIVRPTTIA